MTITTMIKRGLALIICALLVCAESGCAQAPMTDTEGKLQIVTTIFPLYDWVREIVGDRAEITLLLDNGVDLHSFQPGAADMVQLATCDVFVYIGGESDGWVDDALRDVTAPEQIAVNLLEELGEAAKEEEVVAGMQADREEEDEEDENEPELDEHVWLSLKNAVRLVGVLAERIGQADPAGREYYRERAADYCEKLRQLDGEYRQTVDAASIHTLLFGDRFPFRYLTDDYDLNYYAAFVGCSAETEASFDTVIFLANRLDEENLPTICVLESSDGRLAETIRQATKNRDQVIVTFDSLQSVTAEQAQTVTYLDFMKQNLISLRQALQVRE